MTDRTIMLVETVLFATKMAGYEICNDFDKDIQSFAQDAYEIAEKAADAFAYGGGWNAADNVMKTELKKRYAVKEG